MKDKFVYQDRREFIIVKSQCEKCIHYNNGDYSKECPAENIEEIKANKCSCPKRRNPSILDNYQH